MNWFKRLVIKWVREDWDKPEEYASNQAVPRIRLESRKSSTMGGRELDSDATLNFTIYNAIGGKVVEFRRYDRKNDQSDHSIYVIGKDEDFGAKIAKISTLECMK